MTGETSGYSRWLGGPAHELELQADLAGALTNYERYLELAPNDTNAPAVRTEVERLRAQLGQRYRGR